VNRPFTIFSHDKRLFDSIALQTKTQSCPHRDNKSMTNIETQVETTK